MASIFWSSSLKNSKCLITSANIQILISQVQVKRGLSANCLDRLMIKIKTAHRNLTLHLQAMVEPMSLRYVQSPYAFPLSGGYIRP
jgi:hypothetical protein